MEQNNQTILSIKNLYIKAGELDLIKDYNLELKAGEYKVISAPTGTGKTTLFNYIAGVLPEQNFTVTGQIQKAPGLKVSYAFQEPRLIPSISVLKNVMLPLENKTDIQRAESVARVWLERFKLSHKIQDFPTSLSGGEQQRTNLARAFAYANIGTSEATPVVSEALEDLHKLLLLDEPFASQDEQNAQNILSLIKETLLLPETAVLIITHDRTFLMQNS